MLKNISEVSIKRLSLFILFFGLSSPIFGILAQSNSLVTPQQQLPPSTNPSSSPTPPQELPASADPSSSPPPPPQLPASTNPSSSPTPPQQLPASTNPSSSPTPSQQLPTTTPSSDITKKSPNLEKFLGTWQTKDEKSGQLTFIFKSDGKMEYVIKSTDDTSVSEVRRQGQYEFDDKRGDGIKLITSNRTTETLYKFSSDGKELQIQLIGQRPNMPYPLRFDPEKSRKFIKEVKN